MPRDHAQLLRTALQQLESLAAAGVEQLPKAAVSSRAKTTAECGKQDVETEDRATGVPGGINRVHDDQGVAEVPPVSRPDQSAATTALFDVEIPPPGGVSSAGNLEILREEVAGCTLCGELAATRTQTVFGVGNPRARLCFLGEAPGADEDRLGEPFVGRAGQLLDRILAACGLARDEVYILNVLKCRPPGNRNPTPEEAANCRKYLDRQLELIQPEFICCLGAVAAQNLLGTTAPIGRLRGQIHTYHGSKVVCTYHPAYLLRNPAAKKPTWEDMQFLMGEMGIDPAGAGGAAPLAG